MARSECICPDFSCEKIITKVEEKYEVDETRRFRFVKENGAITDRVDLEGIEYLSGPTINSILNCEIKPRVIYKDKEGVHEPKENYCDKGGHLERSLAHDNRKKGHKSHFKKHH